MKTVVVPLAHPLFRGKARLRIALVGLAGAGTRTIFRAVEGPRAEPDACDVEIGLDQARVTRVLLPSERHLEADVIIQVVDATDLERHLELTLALQRLGRPLVLALNKMDATRDRGLHIGT